MKVMVVTPQMLKFLFTFLGAKLEWFEHEWELDCPIIACLEDAKTKGFDVFTFWQRFPDTKPKYKWYAEWDEIAVLDIRHGYNHWWKRISKKTRNMIRKAEKEGVSVRVVEPSEDLAKGIAKIYSESPMRRGKPFRHYGESWKKIYESIIKNSDKTTYIGAYYGDELIGFAAIKYATKYSLLFQILSLQRHFNKEPNNALINKVVEVCASRKIPYIIYERMQRGDDPLGFFKRRNGFEGVYLPRYFIPLTIKGIIAMEIYKKMRCLLYIVLVSRRVKGFVGLFYYLMRRVS
jgi:hypothetical protein